MMYPDISRIGLAAVLISFKSAVPDTALQLYIWKLDLDLQEFSFINETSPGVNSLLVETSSPEFVNEAMAKIGELWQKISKENMLSMKRREVVLPVIYGGPLATELNELSRLTGFTIEKIARLHAAGEYDALCLGAHPGFAYLAGLSPDIVMPRKKTPSLSVKKGSVVIGGAQTGVIAASLPSGWNVIGTTDVELFNPSLKEPSLIKPGDRVRFSILDIVNDTN